MTLRCVLIKLLCVAVMAPGAARLAAQSSQMSAPAARLENQPVLFPQPLSPRIANYNIAVTLDAKNYLLHGQEQLIWHNKSADVITELQFHLYLNAFRNSRSTFMKESGGVMRGSRIDKEGWGYIDVHRITLLDGEDLTASLEFIQPDDGNVNDKTLARVPLPRPLRPGDSVIVHFDFTAKMPQPPFARTGAKEEFFFVAQWFPKAAVYIDGAWNSHQFHANSEFFADYGVYNVNMTVPADHILGATGIEVEVKDNGDGTRTHVYHAEDVHDFAWTSSPEFVEFNDRAQDVDIRVLMQPDRAYQGPRHVEATKVAVEYFQNWYGDYPFPNLTVVDPRRGAGGSGGMEYPTLITAGTTYGLPEGLRAVEAVIIHEFGHNYWYHLLASNEFEESWLDEGINTYTEIQIMNDRYGPVGDVIDVMGFKINNLQVQRADYLFSADLDQTVRKAWEYYPGSYGTNSYAKPGLLLTTLHNYLGKEKMLEVMRAYVARWRFKHPKTQDFIAVVNDVSGLDLNWFFDQALFSNAVLDYSIERVASTPVGKGRGFDFSLATVVRDSSAAPAEDADAAERVDTTGSLAEEGQNKQYHSSFYVRRKGTFKFPVEIAATFSNGETVRETWDGQEIWKKFSYLKPTKLVSATVDPERKIPLDINYTNNSAVVEPSKLGANKLALRWMFWMQFFLDQPEFLNLFSNLIPEF